MKQLYRKAAMLALALVSAAAQAEISLTHTVEVESIVKDKDGVEKTVRAPADRVVPGDMLVYTVTATNTGKDPVQNAKITDTISEHNVYQPNSAGSSAPAQDISITFSADQGKSYLPAAELTVQDSAGKRPATPEEYSHIRWHLKAALPPGSSTQVWFKAKLK